MIQRHALIILPTPTALLGPPHALKSTHEVVSKYLWSIRAHEAMKSLSRLSPITARCAALAVHELALNSPLSGDLGPGRSTQRKLVELSRFGAGLSDFFEVV
jgi:hypothetical protein